MAIQYITDSSGTRTDIIIPINEWNNIISKYGGVKELLSPAKKPSDFAGTLSKEDGEKFKEYLKGD